jgi:hypothetical protein
VGRAESLAWPLEVLPIAAEELWAMAVHVGVDTAGDADLSSSSCLVSNFGSNMPVCDGVLLASTNSASATSASWSDIVDDSDT